MSAGSQPTGSIHHRSLALLRREGITTEGCFSKSWHALPDIPDIVITVCASAAGETCPPTLDTLLHAHWGVEDPAQATGSEEDIDSAFVKAYRSLRHRIEAFLALPLDEIRNDQRQFITALNDIGQLAS